MKKYYLPLILAGLFGVFIAPSYAGNATTEVFVFQTDKGQKSVVAKEIHNTSTRKLYHFVEKEHFDTPEQLYAGGYDSIQIIRYAEKRYYREHNAYTANIADLDLTFSDATKQLFVGNTSRVYLDNGFYYVLTDKLVAVYFQYPQNDSMTYHLDFHFDGTQQCIAANKAAKKTCENLGGTNPTINERMSNWTVYDLPDDFL